MSETVTVGHAQSDGRKYVLEVHSDATGEFARHEYLGPSTGDYTGAAATRHAAFLEAAAVKEFQDAMEMDVMPALRFQTAAEFVARLRVMFAGAERDELCRIARWVLHRITAGDLTETQFQSAFSLNTARWSLLKGRMQTFMDSLEVVEGARGE